MNINVRTNISKDFGDDIEIVINTSNYTKEVGKIVETVQQIVNEVDVIIARNGNEISVININDIIMFYSNDQTNYCKIEKGDFIIKQKLYELENILPKKNFIRISNSTIINIQFVECFDVSVIGNIIVKFKNGMTEHVSKRRVSRSYEIFERKREIVMKKVFKNIFKAIAITCLILEIVTAIYYGIYIINAKKYIEEQEIVEMGRNIRPATDEEINKQLGILVYYFPQFEKLQATGTILALSVLIGTVIGVTMSIDEKSNKKVITTYFAMYVVILSILCLYDVLINQSTNNFLSIAIKILIPYSVVYITVILKKKIDNNKKVKIMNEELKNSEEK